MTTRTRPRGAGVVLGAVVLAAVVTSGCTSPTRHGAAPRRAAPARVSTSTTTRTSTTTTAAVSTSTTATAGAATPCGTSAGRTGTYQHVVWIWMENHSWGQVIGTPGAPYLTALARECGTDTAYGAVGSPSLPNYLGATSGSTQGVTDDADPGSHSFTADNLFRQVRTAGGTERSFVESMPAPCTLVSQGSYAAKHNPAVYFDGNGDRSACAADDLPFTSFSSVLSAGTLPTFTSITPNICDDMHDCPVSTGDQWLSTWVPRILATSSYRSGTTAVVIVWDEPSPVADVVVAPSVRPGTASSAPVNHYSLLRATEELLGLPLLASATTATSLRTAVGF